MRLRGLDLNLLLVLDVLLTLKSVTAAARELNVTQPTLSGSLARLRDHFGDPLLTRAGASMELTPLAEMLREPVRETLEHAEVVAHLRPGFDPQQDRRHFDLCVSDNTALTLLQDVVRRVAQQAPRVTLRLLPPDPMGMLDRLRRHELDFIFTIEGTLHVDHPRAVVLEDTFRCVVWKLNPHVGASLTLDGLRDLGHVVSRFGDGQGPGFDERAYESIGVKRREELVCMTPLLLGPMVVGTERIATLPSRLALSQAVILPLKVLRPPVDLPAFRIFMQWHRSREQDGATVWLRDLVLQVAREQGIDQLHA